MQTEANLKVQWDLISCQYSNVIWYISGLKIYVTNIKYGINDLL